MRIPAEHLMVGRKLLIDLDIEPGAVRTVVRGCYKVVRRSGRGVERALRVVFRHVWIATQEVAYGRIEARCRNLIVGEGQPVPALGLAGGAPGVRPEGGRVGIEDGVQAAKVEI